jgi:hypothetical protein
LKAIDFLLQHTIVSEIDRWTSWLKERKARERERERERETKVKD